MSGGNASSHTGVSKNDGDYKKILSMQDVASLLRYFTEFIKVVYDNTDGISKHRLSLTI